MVSKTTASSIGASTSAKFVPLLFSALLGCFIVGFVGFAHSDAVHNAAHDSRHSLAFPCH